MRVLRLTPFFLHEGLSSYPASYDPIGGMQVQIFALARWLADRGVEQVVLTLGFPGVPEVSTTYPRLEVRARRLPWPRIRSKRTGLVGLVAGWSITALRECMRLRARWRPDLIHVHSNGDASPLVLARIAAALFDVPYVITLHCSRAHGYVPMNGLDSYTHPLLSRIERGAMQSAAATIAISRRTWELARIRLDEQRVVYVPDTLDADAFALAATPERVAALRCKLDLGSGPVIAFIGRISPEKGWPDFVALAAALADLAPTLLVVGDGPQRSQLEAMARGISGARVVVTGFVPHAEVASALALIDVVVVPSHYEELGGAAIEALALGVPTVAYSVGGLAETVGAVARELLVAPGDAAELAIRVREVLGSLDRWRAELRRHRERWHDRRADHVLPPLLATYRRVIEEHRP
jgi:2-deoxystreptamine N-acetyl-D-glucosaminyltransferase/2-deoxystreptamine glucosyltransferase